MKFYKAQSSFILKKKGKTILHEEYLIINIRVSFLLTINTRGLPALRAGFAIIDMVYL